MRVWGMVAFMLVLLVIVTAQRVNAMRGDIDRLSARVDELEHKLGIPEHQ